MLDVIFIAAMGLFVGLAILYVHGCDWLR